LTREKKKEAEVFPVLKGIDKEVRGGQGKVEKFFSAEYP